MKQYRKNHMKKAAGFTLIEMILVLVIISIIVVMSLNYMQQKAEATRIDRTALQIQQILNAGLAYYVVHTSWPPNANGIQQLQTENFLPASIKIQNPWGSDYFTVQGPQAGPSGNTTSPILLYVYTGIAGSGTTATASGVANVIAGKLPMSFTTSVNPNGNVPTMTPCTAATPTCYVVASINIPGQNLNNASAINYAGVYHPGACVPAPPCPLTSMIPEVILVPTSVSGMSDSSNNAKVYPIESFTAFPSDPNGPTLISGTAAPSQCPGSTVQIPCTPFAGTQPPASANTKYWRICLNIMTANGPVNGATNQWAQQAFVAAFTRCVPANEFQGSNLTVWSN
jgi:prepilin-type N-terminal cleavage/methylation domain-containing protein